MLASALPPRALSAPLQASGVFIFRLKQSKEPFFEFSLAALELLIKGFRPSIHFFGHLQKPRFTLMRPLGKATLAFVIGQIQVLSIRFFDAIF